MSTDDAFSNDELLLKARFRLLVENLPKLYLTLIAVAGFLAVLIGSAVSPVILWPWAGALICSSIVRGLHWLRLERRGYDFTPEEIRRRLAETDRIGGLLLMVFASVGYFVLQSPDLLLRTTTMLALWAAAVGTAFYLFVLPRTARNIVLGVTATMCGVFLWTGGHTLWTATPMFLAVSAALIVFLKRNFETFKTAVEAQAVVEIMRREALQLAMTDPLTSLPNRRAFEARLAMLVAGGKAFALGIVDLDDFKPINDTYGHSAGDKALIIVAHRLRSLGDGIFVARLGGDEFALLVEDAERAEALLVRAVELLSAAYGVDGEMLTMGASCGLAFWRTPGDEALLVAQADAALYRAKDRASRGLSERRRGYVAVFKAAA